MIKFENMAAYVEMMMDGYQNPLSSAERRAKYAVEGVEW